MLSNDDCLLLKKITNGKCYLLNQEENKTLQKIINYEKMTKINSFDILYSIPNSDAETDFRNNVLNYIKHNGNVKKINTIFPIEYVGVPTQTKETTKKIIDYIIKEKDKAIVISNTNPLYKHIINYFNKKRKIVILFSNSNDDFNLTYSNLIVYYNIDPNKKVFDFSTKYLIDLNIGINTNFSTNQNTNKIFYI